MVVPPESADVVRAQMRLSDLLGRDVTFRDGARGRVHDLVVDLGAPLLLVSDLVVRTGGSVRQVTWSAVVFVGDHLAVDGGGRRLDGPDDALSSSDVLLDRDVLDTVVYDRVNRRRARVGEVWLTLRDDGFLEVEGLEVGGAPVLRRLALLRPRRSRPPVGLLSLTDVHLTSLRGHRVQLDLPHSPATSAGDDDLAYLLTHLPPGHAADVLGRLPADRADRVARRLHPHIRERLQHATHRADLPGRRRLRRTAGWRTYPPVGGTRR
jgi:hypothetical protein